MGGYRDHALMDAEMRESLGVMEMAMRVKCAFPAAFHFLKGNHENVANEQGRGNHPFIKFAAEGEMVAAYVMRFLGEDFMRGVYRYEHNLPLLAMGRGFLVSHGEPRRPFTRRELVEYRQLEEVVEGLTWTDNGAAEPGSVRNMLELHLGELDADGRRSLYFGGHRPVPGLYATRQAGRYVQFHNPGRQVVALIQDEGVIDLDRDIREIRLDFPIPGSFSG